MSDSNKQNTQTVQSSTAETAPNHRQIAWFLFQLLKHDKSARETIPNRTTDQFLKKLQEDKEFYEAALSLWYKFGKKIRLVGLASAFNVPPELPRAIFTSGAWAFAVHNLIQKTLVSIDRIVRSRGVSTETEQVLRAQGSKLQVAMNSMEDVVRRWPESSLVFDEKVQAEVEVWFRSRTSSSALVAIPMVEKKPQLLVIEGLSETDLLMRSKIKMALTEAGLAEDSLNNIVNAVFKAKGSNSTEKLTSKAFAFRFRSQEAKSEDLLELSYIIAKAAGLAANEFDLKFERMNADRLFREAKSKRALRKPPLERESSEDVPVQHLDIAELEAALVRSKRNLRRKGKK
jgi:hypothetical protein